MKQSNVAVTGNERSPQEIADIKRNPPQILSEQQLAIYLGVSIRSLRNLRQRRLLPHVRLGGRILYRLAEVLRALERLEIRAV